MGDMTQHTTHTTTLPLQVPTQDLLENIMGSMWQTWSWWRFAKYAEGCGWDTYPEDPNALYITVGVEDPDDEDNTWVRHLSVNDIVTATATVLTDHTHVAWDDMDACDGDMVMQQATMGSVVYA